MKKFITLSTIYVILITCTKEEITPRNYPRLETNPVQNITSTGGTFSGKILYTSTPIIDHGFLWSTTSPPLLSLSEKISLGPKAGTGEFNTRVERSLEQGVAYFVRAYAQTAKHFVYGETEKFISLGSKAPEVLNVVPSIGTWGDTIVIIGHNYSAFSENLVVKMDVEVSEIVKASPDSIVCIVPPTLSKGPCDISVSFHNNVGEKKEAFQLFKPEIENIEPSNGTAFTPISIQGQYFSPTHTLVFFNAIEAVISKITNSEIQCRVPEGLSGESAVLKVKTGEGNLESQQDFIIKQTKIKQITPSAGTYGDEITISGENFIIDNSITNSIKFGDVIATIQSISSTEIKVFVPEDLMTPEHVITLNFGNTTLAATQKFSLLPPEIISVTPSVAHFDTRIIIQGKNFSPVENTVLIEGVPAELFSNSKEQIEVKLSVPGNLLSHDLQIQVSSSGQLSQETFSIKSAWKRLADFPEESYAVAGWTVQDKMYVAALRNDTGQRIMYFYDKLSDEWISRSPPPVDQLEMASSFVIDSKIYLALTETGKLWEYNSLTDEWLQTGDLPVKRFSPLGFSINGKGYFAGGYELEGGYNYQNWEYDPLLDLWSRKNDVPYDNLNRGLVYNGTFYTYSNVQPVNYDPVTDAWTTDFYMVDQFLFMIDQNIYTHAYHYNPNQDTSLDRYNIVTESWERTELFYYNWSPAFTFSIAGKGYFLNSSYPTHELWEFDPGGW